MYIDCRSCPVRERMCGDCMVTHLYAIAPPRSPHDLDDAEQTALDMFVRTGLVTLDDMALATVELTDDTALSSVG